MLAGGLIDDVSDDDRRFVVDLGLARRYPDGGLEIGNPIYREVLPRVVNGGGGVDREYALGRGRMDLCVHFGGEKLAIELEVWRGGQRDPEPRGLAQLDEYLESLGVDTGWLVVFDQRATRPPPSKRMRASKKKTPAGRKVTVVRL